MIKTATQKVDLLEYFYEHLSEDDWLEGVDLYQAGKVTGVQAMHNLITCKVQNNNRPISEVRLKIHPSGKVIQWIECTCRKNRSYGQYCEHIAALMIHIDREKANFINKLDVKMPLKPPSISKSKKIKKGITPLEEPTKRIPTNNKEKLKGASQSLLDHLKGSIQNISLISQGPSIRVKIEIKPGSMTNYDLSVDESARFLLSHPSPNSMSNELRALKIYKTPVELGTRIYFSDTEKIVAERSVVVKSGTLNKGDKQLNINHFSDRYVKLSSIETNGTEKSYTFIPVKSCSKYIGQEFIFIPGKGYLPVDRNLVKPDWYELPLSRTFKDDDAAKFIQNSFNDYYSAAPIWLDKNLKQPKIQNIPELSEIKIHSEQEGWFRLDPRYGQGKSSISMAELMLQAKKNKRKYIKAGETWLKIPDFITQHDWDLDEDEKFIKVDTLGLMRLKAAIGDFDKFVGSKKVLQKIRNRIEYNPNTTTPHINHTNLNLRSYQHEGLKWFWWLYQNKLHGLLADEMGLGKTHQAMAVMSAIQNEESESGEKVIPKFLVICPTTVLDHWEDKVNDFAPNLRPFKYHGPKRLKLFENLNNQKDTLITSYGILLRDIKKLSEVSWHAIILDEAHYVKNNNTATYRAACKLQSKIRLCLTGTPMENHLGELKNLFDFLVPGYLGSDDYFRKHFINPIQNKDLETELALQKLIYPLKLRRSKKQVLSDLPAKIEDIRHCTLSNEQVKLYREIINLKAKPLINKLNDDNNPVPYLHVFAILQLLKQVCNHPALLRDQSDYKNHESGKFELLKEIVSEALDSGNKIVIFSQYVKMIKIIKQYCDENKIGCVTMTGQTRRRGKVIETFQTDPDIKIFVGSLLAGGIGIDLTAASVVIHYDRWWNASKENQATDRVHRIGQKKFVQVMKMVTRGTLEEKISKMIMKKQTIFNTFLERDEEIFKTMSRQDLIELLQ
ncbi:MAG: SNF2-related protein [Oligoflexales bacterium]